jgi:ATP-binding cassette subfamily C protein
VTAASEPAISVDALLPTASAGVAARVLGRELGRHRGLCVAGVAASLGAALAGVAMPVAVGQMVDAMVGGRAAGLNGPAAALVVLAVCQGVLTTVSLSLIARVGERVLADLRERVVRRALGLPLGDVERAGTGDLLARVGGDVVVVSESLREAFPLLVQAGLTVALTVGALATLDPRFALAALAAAPVQLLTLRWYLRTSSPLYREEREAAARRAGELLGAIEGAVTIRAFRLHDVHAQRVAATSDATRRLGMRTRVLSERFFGRLNLAEVIGLAAVLAVGFVLVREDAATVGQASAAALLFHRLFDPINILLGLFDQAQAAAAGLTRLVGVAEMPEPDARPSGEPEDGGVVLDDVHFAYAEGHPILHGVSLTIEAGEQVAVVGATGAGKTTLAKLIAGVHEPLVGQVRLGGVPVGELGTSLRRHVCLVSQEVHVFAVSVADNLRFARPSAPTDELRDALTAVGLGSWVDALPDGLETIVGEGGSRMTAAQAQQLALARILLADPIVAVLDEASAEAGSAGAKLLEGATDRVLSGRTAVVVAHRLSQAALADRVVVLERGRIVEVGHHEALVEAGGTYAGLWSAWSAGRAAP